MVCYIVVYRPPPSPRNGLKTSDFLAEFDELVKELSTRSFKVLLLGDFNVHVDTPAKPDSVQFLSSIDEAGLQQHVRGPTHRCGHSLDLVISRTSDTSFVKSCLVNNNAYSDHYIISCMLDVSRPRLLDITSVSRNFRSIDNDEFRKKIAEAFVDFPFTNSADDQISFYNTTTSTVLDALCPAKKRKHKFRSHPVWYTDGVYQARRTRRRLERKWTKSRTECDKIRYLDQVHVVDRLVRKEKSAFFTDQLSDADTKTVFRVLNTLLNRCPSSLPAHESAFDLSNRFSTYFDQKVVKLRETLSRSSVDSSGTDIGTVKQSPSSDGIELSEFDSVSADEVRKLIMSSPSKSCLLDPIPTWLLKENIDLFLPIFVSIVKSSLQSGVFPSCLKEAIVSPLLKKPSLDRENLKNYRPVSNLPFLSKIIEKAALAQLSEHLELHDLNSKHQSAYRKHHSTETALLKVKNDLLNAVDNKLVAFVVLLDLSSAFDTVDHEILLNRLTDEFGIAGSVKSWFASYLSGRTSRCRVAGELSSSKPLIYGVPQGSVVGPRLFSMYTHPLPDLISQHEGINFHSYADDVTLYMFADPKRADSMDQALQSLSNCIAQLQNWMESNMLKLNCEKTEFLVISSPYYRKHVENVTLTISDISIEAGSSARCLGVQFDATLKMDKHVSDLCRALHFHLSNIARIRPFIDKKACEDAIRAIVSSRLDYANSLLHGVNAASIQRLQRVQNRAAKLIYKARKFDHVTPLLKELHWLPVQQRIYFKTLTIVYKCLHGKAPTYLNSLITPHHSARPGLRSNSDSTLLHIPKTHKKAGDDSFQSFAPSLWNEIPQSVRLLPSLDTFKRAIKTLLFDQ